MDMPGKTFGDLRRNLDSYDYQLRRAQSKKEESEKKAEDLRAQIASEKDTDPLPSTLEGADAAVERSSNKLASLSEPPEALWPC
jgi:chromosome segregation ATPase